MGLVNSCCGEGRGDRVRLQDQEHDGSQVAAKSAPLPKQIFLDQHLHQQNSSNTSLIHSSDTHTGTPTDNHSDNDGAPSSAKSPSNHNRIQSKSLDPKNYFFLESEESYSIPILENTLEEDETEHNQDKDKAKDQTEDQDEKLIKQERNRLNVLKEIISSEKVYLESLNLLNIHFITPIKLKVLFNEGSSGSSNDLHDTNNVNNPNTGNNNNTNTGLSGKFSKTDFENIFSNIEQIIQLHNLFFNEIQNNFSVNTKQLSSINEDHNNTNNNKTIVDIFMVYADYFKLYTVYVSSYEKSLSTLNRLNKNRNWKKFLQMKRQTDGPLASRDLTAFLILPVQRIPRYELLFKELLRNTNEKYKEDQKKIELLIQKLNLIARHVNEEKRSMENSSLLLSIQNRIIDLPEALPLLSPARKFIRKDLMKIVQTPNNPNFHSKNDRIVLLFNDAIVYTDTDYTFEGWLNNNEIKVNIEEDQEGKLNIIQINSLSNQLLCSFELDDAGKWIEAFNLSGSHK